MSRSPDRIRFRGDAYDEVVVRMGDLLDRRRGWVNVRPVMTTDDGEEYIADKPSGFNLFSRPPPVFPEATWVPGERRRKGTDADTVGVAHPAGQKAGPILREAGVTLPAGWRVLSDNARRGLVVQLPEHYDPADVLAWLVRCVDVLAPIPLEGLWQADVHAGVS